MPDLAASYSESLKLWVGRFAEAQRVIRELEAENEGYRRRLEKALSLLTDEQLQALALDVRPPLPVVATSDGHGGSCGCG